MFEGPLAPKRQKLDSVNPNGDGWHLRSDDKHDREVFVSHQEIYDDLSANRGAVKYGYHDIEQQKLRMIFGDKQFSDFPENVQFLALLREKLIKNTTRHIQNTNADGGTTTSFPKTASLVL
ncbi:hypothetical protein HED50_14600 [Ochrobactrum oryzae]|nr:hypothetical protein [Brucella oryzae]